jgi:hypothetical protein
MPAEHAEAVRETVRSSGAVPYSLKAFHSQLNDALKYAAANGY